ncbi:putative Alpha/Beta hydrolase protein [Seiridium unicorne]|uniref:Alpha/Beta hydrolase protein n=1 Tax=Seiridium unicorne TaxID=138068 RepID=A0ABR2V8D2_9PEZI
MSSSSGTAVIICHGSYHTPEPYGPLTDALKAEGIDAYCPQLPTADLSKLNVGDVNNPDFDREPPPGGYPQGDEDVAAIAAVLNPLIEEGREVLLIGHSSGGWAATQVAKTELQAKDRKAKGKTGGIIGILYMGAFIIPVGQSVNSFFQQPNDGSFVTPEFMEFHVSTNYKRVHLCATKVLLEADTVCHGQKHGAAGLGTIVNAEEYLFEDIEPADAKKWAATLTASPILTTKLTTDAYASLPCAYLFLNKDKTLKVDYQQGMVDLQSKQTGAFEMYNTDAGHSPHLSKIPEVVEVVKDFVSKIAKRVD